MIKVRWSTTCAGCRKPLPSGSRAFRYHRTLWCGGCAFTHRLRCTAHTVPTRSTEPELVLF